MRSVARREGAAERVVGRGMQSGGGVRVGVTKVDASRGERCREIQRRTERWRDRECGRLSERGEHELWRDKEAFGCASETNG